MRLFEVTQQLSEDDTKPFFPDDSKSNNQKVKPQSQFKDLPGLGQDGDERSKLEKWWKSNWRKQKSKVIRGKRGVNWEGPKWAISPKDAWEILNNQDWRCNITGVEFQDNKYWRPSLDRIDSKKGYVPENIQFLASCVNNAKWDMTEDEFKAMCDKVCNPIKK